MTVAPTPVTSSSAQPNLNQLISTVVAFFAHRNVHKLAATALAAGGLVVGNKFTTVLGAAYAAAMHVAGGLKKLPD